MKRFVLLRLPRPETDSGLIRCMQQLSIHIRGPTWLKQLAVYFPSSAHPKRSDQATFHKRSHGHHHLHHRFKGVREFHERDQGKRGVGDLVTAVIDGQLVSWTNVYGGPSAVSSSPTSIGAMTKDVNAKPLAPSTKVTTTITLFPVSQALATPSPIMPAKVIPEGTIDSWSRRAYYNAAAGDADGFTFLNHCGGTEGMPGTLDGGPSLVLGDVEGIFANFVDSAHLFLMLLLTGNLRRLLPKYFRTTFLTTMSK